MKYTYIGILTAIALLIGMTAQAGVTHSWTNNAGWILQSQTNALSVGISNNWVDVPGSDSFDSTNITLDAEGAAHDRRVEGGMSRLLKRCGLPVSAIARRSRWS